MYANSLIILSFRQLEFSESLLAALGQDPQLKCIPVIMFTSSTLQHDIKRCYELGANAYITKPSGLPQLVIALKRILDFWESCELCMPMKGQ